MTDEWGPGTNTGHGHVWPRPDGMVARCTGTRSCRTCQVDEVMLAGRIAAERVPALRWEWRDGSWIGRSGELAAAMVELSSVPAGPAWWRLLLPDAAPLDQADTPDAAKAAAESAFRAWCERAGLVARVGFVPPYKADAAGPRTAQGNGAERGEGGGR